MMAGVVPSGLRHLLAVVRAVSPQLLPEDCLPARTPFREETPLTVRQLVEFRCFPPWDPFEGLPRNLSRALQQATMHSLGSPSVENRLTRIQPSG